MLIAQWACELFLWVGFPFCLTATGLHLLVRHDNRVQKDLLTTIKDFSRLLYNIQGFQGLEFGSIKFKAFQDFQGLVRTPTFKMFPKVSNRFHFSDELIGLTDHSTSRLSLFPTSCCFNWRAAFTAASSCLFVSFFVCSAAFSRSHVMRFCAIITSIWCISSCSSVAHPDSSSVFGRLRRNRNSARWLVTAFFI